MNSIFITLKEARYQHLMNNNIIHRLVTRYSPVNICDNVLWAFKWIKNSHGLQSLTHLPDFIVGFLIGKRRAGQLFNLCQNETDRFSSNLLLRNQNYCFHWCPADQIDSIKQKGLLPGKNHLFVYMTDDYDYIAKSQYFQNKAITLGKDILFQLIRINMKKLIKEQEVFLVDAPHEFAVSRIPPECIEFSI